MTLPLTVSVLGSCRIASPLQKASVAGDVVLANLDIGYLHASGEVLQVLDWVDGEGVEAELKGLLPFPRGNAVPSLPQADAFIVEISSLKKVVVGDWVLQLNYFTERFRPHEGLLDRFNDSAKADQRDRRAVQSACRAEFAQLDAASRKVFVEAHVEKVSREELERDLIEIAQRLHRPVLFVTHCNIPGQHGQILRDRERISLWMADLADRVGLPVYDPTPDVIAFGIDKAMTDEGRGLAHYSEAFQTVLSRRLIEETRKAIAAYHARTLPKVARARATPRRLPPAVACADIRSLSSGLLKSGDLSGAASAARIAIAKSPPCANAMSVLAQAAFRAGDPAQALEFALAGCEGEPESLTSWVMAAKARTRLKQFENAAQDWQRVAILRPRSAWPLIEAGRCKLRSKRPEAALALAEAALDREPNETLALAIKAEALLRLRRFDDIPDVGELLAKAAPEAALSVLRFMLSARHYQGLARVAQAVAPSHLAASGIVSSDLVSQLMHEVALVSGEKNWPAAGELLRATLALNPDSQSAARMLTRLTMDWVAMARAAAAAGDLAGAREAYDVALSIDPSRMRALREAASAAEKMGDWKRATGLWSRVCDTETADVAALGRAARAAELAGEGERALPLLRRLCQADPANAKAAASLASNVRKLAKHAREMQLTEDGAAVRIAGVVLAVSPDNEICRRILRKTEALLASDLRRAKASGHSAEQEDLARRLLSIAPERPEALRTLSQLQLAHGRLDDAVGLLGRLVAAQAHVPAHWVKLGRCLKLLKRFDEAREAALKALTLDPDSHAARKILSDVEARLA